MVSRCIFHEPLGMDHQATLGNICLVLFFDFICGVCWDVLMRFDQSRNFQNTTGRELAIYSKPYQLSKNQVFSSQYRDCSYQKEFLMTYSRRNLFENCFQFQRRIVVRSWYLQCLWQCYASLWLRNYLLYVANLSLLLH